MPPKAKSKSPGPKAKAKGEVAPKAKARARPKEEEEALLKEGTEMFEKYKREEAEGLDIGEFAECIRDMNIKKRQPWTDDLSVAAGWSNDELFRSVTRPQWKILAKIKPGDEVAEHTFFKWWPTFVDLVEAKVAEVAAAEQKKEAGKTEKAIAEAAIYDSEGVWNIAITDMLAAIDEAYKRGRTPLIIDNTENYQAETFFQYQAAHIVECKQWIFEKARRKGNLAEILAEQRDNFFQGRCFNDGKTVVFRLANSAADIKNTFDSEVFPSLSLLDAKKVSSCLGQENAGNWKGSPFQMMCSNKDQEEDCEHIGINDKFRVIAITQFQEEDYVGFLETMFPLDMCQPIKPSVAA